MAAKYPAIPEPTTDPASLRDAVLSLKQAFEILTGQRGNPDYRAVLLPELTVLAAAQATDHADITYLANNAAVRYDVAQALSDTSLVQGQMNLRMGKAKLLSAGTDMDTVQVPGLYDVAPPSANVPGGLSTIWWYLEVWQHSGYAPPNDWMIQRATTLTEPNVQCWVRLNAGGGPWQAWHKFTLP